MTAASDAGHGANDEGHENAWLNEAACRGHAHEFFEYQSRPLHASQLELVERRLINKFCDHCPVKPECLEDAYRTRKTEDVDWVRGGLRPTELRRGRRSRGSRKAATAKPNPNPPQGDTKPMTIAQTRAAERARKLLAKASHNNTSDAEAEIFFAAAFKLMEEHGLEEAALRDADPNNDPLTHTQLKLSSSTWRTDITLGSFVAKLTDTQILKSSYVSGWGASLTFYGRASNVGRAVELFTSLVVQANTAAARRRSDWHGCGDVRKWTASVREGFIVALGRRLEALHKERPESLAPPGTGLVPVSLRSEAEDYAKQFSTGPGRASSRSIDPKGWTLGRQDGNNAGLGGAALGGRQAIGQ